MGHRGVWLAGLWVVASLCAGGIATARVQPLRRESDALLTASRASADAFASSFDGQFADRQLADFAARRDVVTRVQRWQRVQLLSVLGVAAGLFAAWLLWMLARLQSQLAPDAPSADRV